MASETNNLFITIPGCPPAGYQEWAGIYESKKPTVVADKAINAVNPVDKPNPVSAHVVDELSLSGHQYETSASKDSFESELRSRNQGPEPSLLSASNFAVVNSDNTVILPSIYGNYELPIFGSQYGCSAFSSQRKQSSTNSKVIKQPTGESIFSREPQCVEPSTSRDFNNSFSHAPRPQYSSSELSDIELELNKSSPRTPYDTRDGSGPTSCTICTEDFSSTRRPPEWISQNCSHKPSACSDCIAKCIRIDLDSKLWNQIKCPECNILLIYEDIRRLADFQTFSRYETMSFRSAVSADRDFVWCQKCDFGQLHTTGETQPIVRCLNCGFRSCYSHSIPWHDRLTCDDYDEMLRDPDGFQSAIEKDEEAARLARALQEEEDRVFARRIIEKERRVEVDRQRQLHEEQLRRARAEQEAEARRRRELELARKREAMKQRQREEALSIQTVQATTKSCPGCRWPIEKNRGCDHMTCIKCRKEFCWSCLADYNEILRYGNSRHKRSCIFHSNNLPS